MPSIRLSRTACAIFSISVLLLTWYGISVTMSALRVAAQDLLVHLRADHARARARSGTPA